MFADSSQRRKILCEKPKIQQTFCLTEQMYSYILLCMALRAYSYGASTDGNIHTTVFPLPCHCPLSRARPNALAP